MEKPLLLESPGASSEYPLPWRLTLEGGESMMSSSNCHCSSMRPVECTSRSAMVGQSTTHARTASTHEGIEVDMWSPGNWSARVVEAPRQCTIRWVYAADASALSHGAIARLGSADMAQTHREVCGGGCCKAGRRAGPCQKIHVRTCHSNDRAYSLEGLQKSAGVRTSLRGREAAAS